MSTNILLNYKKGGTIHTTSDDLESIVYILIWMCILYTGPGTLRQDKHVTNTVLKPWVTVTNNTDAVNLGAIKAALKFDPSIMTDEFTTFFKPLCLITHRLLIELGKFSATDHMLNYAALRKILLEGFSTVEEVPNWSAAKDVYGYSLLQWEVKHKAPSYMTSAWYDTEDSPQPVRQACHHWIYIIDHIYLVVVFEGPVLGPQKDQGLDRTGLI